MTTGSQYVQDEFFESLLGDFLDESSQLLDQLNEDLLVLDNWVEAIGDDSEESCDDDLMNSMFRSAHSIKGLSAMLGLKSINVLTHRIENIFDASRKQELHLRSSHVQVIFEAVDRLIEMIAHLRDTGSDELDITSLVENIENLLNPSAELMNHDKNHPENLPSSPLADSPETKESCSIDREAALRQQADEEFNGVVDETGVPSKYLAIFIDEAEMAVDTLAEQLLGQESGEHGADVEALLVTSHKIKGSAASIGLNRISKLAHLMEDTFQALREEEGQLTSQMTDAMLKCADALRLYVAGLRTGNVESDEFPRMAADLLVAQVGCLLASSLDELTAAASPSNASEEPEIPLEQLARESLADMASDYMSAWAGRVRFAPGLEIVGLKAQLIVEKLGLLGDVFYLQPPATMLEDIESLESLTFAVATDVTSHQLDACLKISGVESFETLFLTKEESTSSEADSESDTASPSKEPSSEGTSQPQIDAKKDESPQAEANASNRLVASARPAETIRVDIERLDHLMNLAGQLAINKARFSRIGDGLRSALPSKQLLHSLHNAKVLVERLEKEVEPASNENSPSIDLDAIRSHARRLGNDLQSVFNDLKCIGPLTSGVNELFESVHQFDRVADGIQQCVMDTRMVPIGPLFGRFKRVIRDITRASGKEIRLDIRGEKTELDKRMVDELGDPLIHMVRNSADHGIQMPDERKAAGKPPKGVVTLDAFHQGNSIVIRVQDDGRGLDANAILQKAIEKGLVSQADAERMTNQQIYQLIWEPGLTTAKKVTEISGRGMGMDIVRSKIEDLSGVVEVDSELGVGTIFSIRLPLTMAILPSLMAEINGNVFAMPIESVVEIVSVNPEDISSVHGMRTATIRGRVVSMIQLDDIFEWHQDSCRTYEASSAERTLVIIGTEGKEIGVEVNALLGEEDVVIKSLAENYRNVHGIAGASILGDGSVSLILDIASLIDMASCLTKQLSQEIQ